LQDVEANPGDTISQVRAASRNSYPFKPNVVLINAGTNDASQNLQAGAGERMEGMIKDMWAADGMVSLLLRTNFSISLEAGK
jgi:lysophospholipase L1-like esterase